MKYAIKNTVISVYVGGKMRPTSSEKKANVIFDTEKDPFKSDGAKDELFAAYKSGFLVKQSGKDCITYEEESELNEKEFEAKKAKINVLSSKLGGLRKDLKKLEADFDQNEKQDEKAKIEKLIEAKTSEIKGVETDIEKLK